MRITCPSCAAEYNVPAAVPSGRVVRCARCGSEWAPVPNAPPAVVVVQPAPPPPPEVGPEVGPELVLKPAPFMSPPAAERPARYAGARQLPLVLAWLASVLAVAGLVVAGYVFRPSIMHAWPPSLRLYAALGLT